MAHPTARHHREPEPRNGSKGLLAGRSSRHHTLRVREGRDARGPRSVRDPGTHPAANDPCRRGIRGRQRAHIAGARPEGPAGGSSRRAQRPDGYAAAPRLLASCRSRWIASTTLSERSCGYRSRIVATVNPRSAKAASDVVGILVSATCGSPESLPGTILSVGRGRRRCGPSCPSDASRASTRSSPSSCPSPCANPRLNGMNTSPPDSMNEAIARIDPDSDGVVAQAVAPLIHRRQGTAYSRHRRSRQACIGLLLPEPIDQSERQEVGEGPSLDSCGRYARCPDSCSGPIVERASRNSSQGRRSISG